MKDKYNIKELEEKLNRCKNMKLEDINPDDVDEINSIKQIEENQVMKEFQIF